MGQLLDILRGKVTDAAATTPLRAPTSGRSVVSLAGVASTSSIGQTLLGRGQTGWSLNIDAYRCAVTTAANLASVDLAVLVGDEAREDHPMARLWNTVGAGRTRASARVVREVMFLRAEIEGEAFAFLEGRDLDPLADPIATHPIYDTVQVVIDGKRDQPEDAELLGFRIKRQGQTIGLLPDQVLWLRYPHPSRMWEALAPWKAAMAAAELDAKANEWQLGEFINGGNPNAVVYLGDLAETQYVQAKAEWLSEVQGPGNAGKAILTAGPTQPKIERLSFTAKEMGYMESRGFTSVSIMKAFGYPPDYFQGQATYENRRASKVQVWSDLYLPKLDVMASEFDRQLLPAETETAAFDVSNVDALRESVDSQVERIVNLTDTDLVMMDEARAELGYDPLPGGIGQQTITGYRAALTPLPIMDMTGDNTPARSLLPARPRLFAVRGQVRAIRPAPTRPVAIGPTVRRTPRTLSRPRVQSLYDAHEAIGQRALHAYAERQRRIVLRQLEKLRTSQLDTIKAYQDRGTDYHRWVHSIGTQGRAAADEVFDAAYWRDQLAEATEPWMRGVWETGGVNISEALSLDFSTFDRSVLDAMDRRRQVLAEQVTGTTRKAIDSAMLTAGAESGWDIPTMADALRAVFDDLDDNRARTIARTETVGGYNGASNLTASASGVVTARIWLAAKDSRVRDSHAEMDGERVEDSTVAYSNGLMFPGDPTGPPEETINCRCVETYDLDD